MRKKERKKERMNERALFSISLKYQICHQRKKERKHFYFRFIFDENEISN